MTSKTNWQALENVIAYQFKQPALLKQAFTHRSHNPQHNERLEFLGDALLETIISNVLYHRYPNAPEGDLTRLRASIVKGTTLASIAKKYQFGDYLQLGSGERKSGGKRRETTLADAVEALIAAVFLDSNFQICTQFTLKLFAETLAIITDPESLKDAKTRLQEYLQGRGLPLPSYTLVAEIGPDHARQFTIRITTHDQSAEGSASSRKKAEQVAAEILLKHYLEQI